MKKNSEISNGNVARKAWKTRKANKEAKRAELRERALKAWKTRTKNRMGKGELSKGEKLILAKSGLTVVVTPAVTSAVTSASVKKVELLDMAKKGEKRPDKTKVGSALRSYVDPRSGSYDPDFNKKLRELAPIWFQSAKSAK